MGSESARVLKIYYVPTLLVPWGRNRAAGPPFSAAFKVQRKFPRNLVCSGDSPPGTFGVSPDHPTRRVSRPLFWGHEEVGKLREPAKDRWGERLQTTREEDFIQKRKEERRRRETDENRRRRKPLHLTDVRAAGGGIPGGPGNCGDFPRP